MGRLPEGIGEELGGWLVGQPLFFVATAPLAGEGHVNCSPKGNRGEFAVLDGTTVAYLDQSGSGVETIAHLRENGRITIMFCAFTGPARIVRLQGRGEFVLREDPRFDDLAGAFETTVGVGARAVIVAHLDLVADSCGYGVPYLDFVGHRPALDGWANTKGAVGLVEYRTEKNRVSIDDLPGIDPPPEEPVATGDDAGRR